MIKDQYETLRERVLNASNRNQEFILFVEYGLIGWLETLSECYMFSLPKEEKPVNFNILSNSLQSQATQILTDMIFYCLEVNKEIQ
jgi:hypothetical protein